MRLLLRSNGTQESFNEPVPLSQCHRLLDAETLDVINLKNGHVMFVDDAGHFKELDYNREATRIVYGPPRELHDPCIVGDALIVPDAEYADPPDEVDY